MAPYDVKRSPAYGYRRIWAILRRRTSWLVNKKRAYRLMKVNGWLMNQPQKNPGLESKGDGAWPSAATSAGT